MDKYEAIIGLEIHVELATKSKMFCQCSADHFGKPSNTQVCPVCLGMPGALPVSNAKALEFVYRIAKALNCKLRNTVYFDRKHYFYPDLPKGYQISQYDKPVGENGYVELPRERLDTPGKKNKNLINNLKRFRIQRVHIEEDTAKLIRNGNTIQIDFNRSSVPLVEIVTMPDFSSADDVKQFLEELQVIIRYLGVSDADMEKGSMRLEPNISLRPVGDTKLPNYKVEVKNINSFSYVKKAIEYEIIRQSKILDSGKTPQQETRSFDSKKGITVSMRTKENANDYRYFPEPDIPPVKFGDKVEEIQLPEMPIDKIKRFITEYNVELKEAFLITRNLKLASLFEEVVSQLKKEIVPQKIANFFVNKKVSPTLSVQQLIKQLKNTFLSTKMSEDELYPVVQDVIKSNPKVVQDYKNGKTNAIMFLVGQVMRATKGQADANMAKSLLEKLLS